MATPQTVSHRDALDIVFANRNRAYGAYQLRRQYPAALGRALAIGLLFIGVLLLLPRILSAVSGLLPEKTTEDDERKTTTIIISPPPQPPLVKTPPPPTKATVKFLPPVVMQDPDVPQETPPPGQDDLKNTQADVGKVNADGPTDGQPILDDPDLGTGTGIMETQPAEDDNTYESYGVQKPPSFPGGEADLLRYLAKNMEYPGVARENGIQGYVVLTFVVGKDGSIEDVAMLKDIGGGCGKEAMRAVRSMPRWSPGENNGQPVKVRFTLPVRFRLD